METTMADFGKSCISSFVNSVDYNLCMTDYWFGNVKLDTCDDYFQKVKTDMEYVRTLSYENNYNYIWD